MAKRRKKKRKFIVPKAGLKSRFKAGQVSPYSSPVYQKGFIHARLRHVVLTANQMSEADKRFVNATLKTIVTAAQVLTLPDGKNGWSCLALDNRARAYVVSYHGIEVALFYKRQLTEITLQPGDRYPEGVCQDPEEAWQRLDLLGLSAKKANLVISTQHKRVEDESKLLYIRVETLQTLNDSLERENTRLKESYDKLQKQIKKPKRKR